MTATFRPDWRASPEKRRGVAVMAGSAVLHVAVLAVIGLGLVEAHLDPIPVENTPIYLEMQPRPLREGETARVPAPSQTKAVETRPLTGARPDLIAPRKADEEEDDRPSPPAPRAAAGVSGPAAAAGQPGAADAWAYRPETMGAAVGRSLRTGAGGCRIMDGRLNPGEQALCDDRFNAGAAEAARRHPLGDRTQTASEQRRNEEFAREGAAALRRYEARRAPLRGGVGIVVGSGECPGGNLGAGCAGAHLDPSMRQGAQNTNRLETGRQGYQPLPGHHD